MDQRIFKILVVDDTPKNIQVIATFLKTKGYEVAFATNGIKALELVAVNAFDLILLDIMMPGIDGYETCRRLKTTAKGQHIPVIFLTAKTDEESIIEGFDSGGVDYITKPFNHRELISRVQTHLKLKDYEDNLEKKVHQLTEEIEATQREVVLTMGTIAETRSKETGNHVKRVGEYSYIFALKYGLAEEEARLLREASPMHDLGKLAIPDSILHKPGGLDADEWEIMKTHAEKGYEMLRFSDRPILKAASLIAYTHHEKFDGSGYPNSVVGEDIHIYGRITALCDVFDALGSSRSYKKAWPDEKIFELIRSESGKHFDPNLVDIFFENLDDFVTVRNSLVDL
jgi:putative two-component system response regulator